MDPETKVDVYKRLTLELLGVVGGWIGFDDIAAHFELNDGEVHGNALRGALAELLAEGKAVREERSGYGGYRIEQPQEFESLAEKVKRLEAALETSEAERLRLLGQLRTCGTVGECVDTAAALAKSVLECAGLRAEQAADRAAVTALVEALPLCEANGPCVSPTTRDYDAPDERVLCCDEHDPAMCHPAYEKYMHHAPHAAPLRALQTRMATWPSDGYAVQPDQRAHVTVEPAGDAPGQWVARHVQRDIVTQGDSLPHALRMLAEAIEMAGEGGPATGTDAPFLGMQCVAQGSSGPATAPREAVANVDAEPRTRSVAWERLQEETKDHGWDSDHGEPVTELAWRTARSFYDRFASAYPDAPKPFVSPCGDGTVHLAWAAGGDRIVVELGEIATDWTCRDRQGHRTEGACVNDHAAMMRVAEHLGLATITVPSKRYVGEFGDIDEPGVGDVEGYGRWG